MKNKLVLSIAMTSVACLAPIVNMAASTATPVERAEVHSGKCASGKCGTVKAYAASKLSHDPQGYLVLARDGKCGLSGQGVAANTDLVAPGKCADGVCGQ